MRSTVALLILLAVVAGFIILQVHLSKNASRWPGLVLPVITLALSFLFVLNVQQTGDLLKLIRVLATAFITGNVPTMALLVVYAVTRRKFRG